MVRRVLFLSLLLACPFASLFVFAPGAGAQSLQSSDGTAVPASIQPNSGNPNLLFRDGLTNVELQDTSSTPSLRDLAAGTVWEGKGVVLRQTVTDKLSLEGQSAVNATQPGDLPTVAALSGSGTTAASGKTGLAAKWKPAEPLFVSFSTTSEATLNRDRDLGQSTATLSRDTQEMKTEWKALSATKLSLKLTQEKLQSSASYDARTSATVQFSQGLGKTGLTWNLSRGWKNERPDSTNPASEMVGGVNSTSFDWDAAAGTKLSLGGSWGEMDTPASATRESTRDLFLKWDRALSQRVRLQMGASYGTKSDTLDGVPYWEGEQATVRMGQKMTLSDTASALFEVKHSVAQENGAGWKTDESAATFSLRKMF